jgi:hypothetical protein
VTSVIKKMTVLMAGIALVLVQASKVDAAQPLPPPGSAEQSLQGTVTVCFAPGTTNPESCDQSGVTFAPVSVLEVGQIVWDADGNACGDGMETLSVAGSAFLLRQKITISMKMNSYDPGTRSGDATGKGYSGGTCKGAIFNDSGATERSNAAFHFVISQSGKRLDAVVTGLSFATEEIGSFSVSAQAFRQ